MQRRGFGGNSVAVRLLALILVPLVGMSVAAAAEITTLVESSTAARHVEHFVRAASSIDAAIAAYEQEITPAFTAAVARNPSLLGTPKDAPEAPTESMPSLTVLRARTDAAVAHLHVPPALRTRLTAQVAQARSGIDNATDLATAFAIGTKLLARFAAAERGRVRAARSAGLDRAGRLALTNVQLAAEASQTAAAEVGSYTPTQFATASTRARVRATATQVWSAAVRAARDLEENGTGAVVEAWHDASRLPAVRTFNTFLAAQIKAGTPFVGAPVITRWWSRTVRGTRLMPGC